MFAKRLRLVGSGLVSLALVLGAFAYGMPRPENALLRAAELTRVSSEQLEYLEKRHGELTDPERRILCARLVDENRRLYRAIQAEEFDEEHLKQLADSLTVVAESLDALSVLLDDAPPQTLAAGLGKAAEYLEAQVSAAEAAAKRLEDAGELLQADSLRLAELLRSAPLDLEAVAQVHEALGSFSDGTVALETILQMPQLPAIRKGLRGLETSLNRGADQVDTLASYSYPVIYFEGIRPRAAQRPFWPAGGEIAGGMHEAASGVRAADKELDTLGNELPRVREALASSRKIIDRSRDTLGTVLQYRAIIEPLVKSLPDTTARLADDLPKITKQLSATLRETQHLREVAAGLRNSQKQLEKSLVAWPMVRENISSTSQAIQAQRDHLHRVLERRRLVDAGDEPPPSVSAETVALWKAQGEAELLREQSHLRALKQSLALTAEAQAEQGNALGSLLTGLRWLLVVAAVGVLATGFWLLVLPGPRVR